MFYANNLVKSYGDRDIFNRVSFVIGDGERVGLVGPNGAGKTTLIRLLSGQETPTEGQAGARGGAVGYLKQQADHDPANTLAGEMWTAYPDIVAIQEKLNGIAEALESGSDEIESLIDEQTDLYERYEILGGYQIEANIHRILRGLGFKPDDHTKLCADFSGGWRMRIALAKILIRHPDHVLLDEPTNHLDKTTRGWLAGELSSYSGTLVIVTHDTAFLDKVVNRVLEVGEGGVESYTGNYSAYRKLKKAKEEHLRVAAERQAREIARQRRFIERFRAKATKAAQVKSREKALERIVRIEPPKDPPQVQFQLRSSGRTEREVVAIRSISHAFDEGPVLLDVSLTVERGQKVVFVGPNGGGKTTLLRIAAGELSPSEGSVAWAERARVAYYAQHQDEALDPAKTVHQEVEAAADGAPEVRIRGVLGRFLFRGDDVFKPVNVLSGGERSRVALAKFLIQPTNVLLLDEPTNHLDVPTRESLIQALQSYDGTILCASHDPAILESIATTVYEINGGECRKVDSIERVQTEVA